MRTIVVIAIDHPDDLNNVSKQNIEEAFEEAGDVAWAVGVQSIEREDAIA